MKKWIKTGLSWGLTMFFAMNFIYPFFAKESLVIQKILIAFPFWVIGGLFFGYTQKKRLEKES